MPTAQLAWLGGIDLDGIDLEKTNERGSNQLLDSSGMILLQERRVCRKPEIKSTFSPAPTRSDAIFFASDFAFKDEFTIGDIALSSFKRTDSNSFESAAGRGKRLQSVMIRWRRAVPVGLRQRRA